MKSIDQFRDGEGMVEAYRETTIINDGIKEYAASSSHIFKCKIPKIIICEVF
jgi:hypothetical protein